MLSSQEKSALLIVRSVINNGNSKTPTTIGLLESSLLRKQTNNSFVDAASDIKNIALLKVKNRGYEILREALDNFQNVGKSDVQSYNILYSAAQFDKTGMISKNLQKINVKNKEKVELPHEVRVFFNAEVVTPEDIARYALDIKNECALDDAFFNNVFQKSFELKRVLPLLQTDSILPPQQDPPKYIPPQQDPPQYIPPQQNPPQYIPPPNPIPSFPYQYSQPSVNPNSISNINNYPNQFIVPGPYPIPNQPPGYSNYPLHTNGTEPIFAPPPIPFSQNDGQPPY